MSVYDNPAFKDPQVQMQIFVLFVTALISMWVVNDARNRGLNGWTAFWWGFGILLLLPFVLPVWLIFRPKTKSGATGFADLFPRAPLPDVPENAQSSTRSKICDHCGKFYLGSHSNCPHCQAPISS